MDGIFGGYFRQGLMASAAIACVATATPAIAQTHTFNVPEQDAASGVAAFARQADIQLLISARDARGRRTNAVRGDFSVADGLQRLLANSGLRAQATGAQTYSVVPIMLGAQSAPPSTGGSPGAGEATLEVAQRGGAAADSGSAEQEIVVTGTNIRGQQAAGSNVIVIDQDDIERSGYGRVQDVLANITQNFQGVSETFNQVSANNLNNGNEVQLRGLGPGTTLTLVNGRRQAPGGTRGIFVDISSIAASAIRRIEILPEGASALYGSDAIGGVVNIILRDDFEGVETRLRYGTAGGEADELQAAILAGTSWPGGHILAGYEYNERDPLFARDRAYSAANGDLRPFGGTDFRGFASNPGTVLDSSRQPFAAIPTGQDGTNLQPGDLLVGQVNYADIVTARTVIPGQETHSAFANAGIDIGENWKFLIDGRFATRDFKLFQRQFPFNATVPATNAFNRFGAPVIIAYDFTEDLGPVIQNGTTDTYFGSAGFEGDLGQSWNVRISGSYARERNRFDRQRLNTSAISPLLSSSDPNIALNLFGDGSFTSPATLQQLYRFDFEVGISETWSANLITDGTLFQLPAGPLRAAIGADYRNENISVENDALPAGREAGREVTALFAELAVPILGPRDDASAAGKLDASLAGRFEHYSDVGGTFNPKIGLAWRPIEFLGLRGTWGTSFRAPPFASASSEFVSNANFLTRIPDPNSTSPDGRSNVLALSGATPDIGNETAQVWTAGVDIYIPPAPHTRLSATFYDIDYKDKIQTPGSASVFLTQQLIFAPVTILNPSQAQIDAICNGPNFFSGPCAGLTIAAIIDGRVRNLSAVHTQGLDFELRTSFDSSFGNWSAGVHGTYVFFFNTALTETAPAVDVANTVGNPLKFRVIGDLAWRRDGLSAFARVNHTGGYRDVSFTPDRDVDSWTTVDIGLGYRFEDGLLNGTRIYLNAINLFNERPPFVNNPDAFGYDGANANILGRRLSFQIVKQW